MVRQSFFVNTGHKMNLGAIYLTISGQAATRANILGKGGKAGGSSGQLWLAGEHQGGGMAGVVKFLAHLRQKVALERQESSGMEQPLLSRVLILPVVTIQTGIVDGLYGLLGLGAYESVRPVRIRCAHLNGGRP